MKPNIQLVTRSTHMSRFKALITIALAALTTAANASDSSATSAAPYIALPTANEGTGCGGVGLTAFSPSGMILSCVGGVWKGTGGINTVVVGCTGAVGQFQSACVAACPASTTLVGGGCTTPNINWEVNGSTPSGNGWYCWGSEDHGSGWYNFSVTGYAVCAY